MLLLKYNMNAGALLVTVFLQCGITTVTEVKDLGNSDSLAPPGGSYTYTHPAPRTECEV